MSYTADPYPINLNLHGRPVLLVGGGKVATQKIQSMVRSGAHITVVAPYITDEIQTLATQPDAHVALVHRRYESSDLDGRRLVLTCTDDREVNQQVYLDAEDRNIWCNSADDPVNCAWTLPSVARQGDLQITISTAGKSPALSMWLRKRFEREFDERWTELLDVLATVRAQARSELGTSELSGWLESLDGGAVALALSGDSDAAASHLRKQLGLSEPDDRHREPLAVGQ